MFHWRDNTFFGRRADGSVRVLRFAKWDHKYMPEPDGDYDSDAFADLSIDLTIPANEWASIVSSVSLHGESGGRFYAAKAFHHGFDHAEPAGG